jgi:hydroxymethylglutaryl-CoA reductase (NADPH)
MFPASLLAKLFVRGSLKNTADGFAFRLKNVIDSGTINGIGPLTVDETSYSAEAITLTVNGKEIRGDQVGFAQSVYSRTMMEIHIAVRGEPLAPGEHTITLPVQTYEAGRLQIQVTEPLSEDPA